MERRRKSGLDTGDLLSMLLAARDEETGEGMSDKQLRDEVMTILLAGHETTALNLTWTFYLLTEYPEAEAKLLAGLGEQLGDRAPTVADLPTLPYAGAVIKESLRLYPPAWGFGREALSGCEIGSYRIPAGTQLIVSQWVTHRNERFFEKADVSHPTLARRLDPRAPEVRPLPLRRRPQAVHRSSVRDAGGDPAARHEILQRFRLRPTKCPVGPRPSLSLRLRGSLRNARGSLSGRR